MRILYVVLFCIIFSVMDIIVAVLALVQSIIAVVSGEPSPALQDFGQRLGLYLKQILDFVSFSSEEKPFPFADWPEPENLADETSGDQSK